MNPYAGALQTLGRTRGFAWIGARVLHRLDRPFRGRRRSVTSFGTGFPLCYLAVRGRRSGEERVVPLLYVADGDGVVLIASNWGARRDPAWALNLEAATEATVTVDGESRTLSPRRASGEELDGYWTAAFEFWPGYAGYRRRAGREIPIFVLEPLGSQDTV